jgi:hypothetical protein
MRKRARRTRSSRMSPHGPIACPNSSIPLASICATERPTGDQPTSQSKPKMRKRQEHDMSSQWDGVAIDQIVHNISDLLFSFVSFKDAQIKVWPKMPSSEIKDDRCTYRFAKKSICAQLNQYLSI